MVGGLVPTMQFGDINIYAHIKAAINRHMHTPADFLFNTSGLVVLIALYDRRNRIV